MSPQSENPALPSRVRGLILVGALALLLILALVLGLYGLGLFLLPALFGAFWPWPVDSFNGQLYSVVFTTAAVGAVGLCRWAALVERLALGVSYACWVFLRCLR